MSKKSRNFLMMLIGLVVLILSVSLVLLQIKPDHTESLESTKATPLRKLSPQDKIWVISDLHYLSETLFDDGEKFQFIKATAAGKDLDFPQERMEALIWQIEQERPHALLVSGDLTLNGEKASALELATYFQRIKELGTAVYVIPGNHDIADGWARSYQGDNATRTEQILAKEWRQIFKGMGYDEAISQDTDSLSYAVEPFSDLVIVMIDTNKYIHDVSGSSPATSGKLREKTYSWLEEVFTKAHAEGKRILPVMHHNLIDHNELLNKGFTIDDAASVQDFFFRYELPVVLTGHIHMQSSVKVSRGKESIFDIATGSFAILSNSIGEISVTEKTLQYQRKGLELAKWAQETGQKEERLLNYQTYSQGLFQQDGEAMGYRQMFEEGWYNEKDGEIVAEFVGRMNCRYFDGFDYDPDGRQAAKIKQEPGYQLLTAQPESFLWTYMNSIIKEGNINALDATIPFPQKNKE